MSGQGNYLSQEGFQKLMQELDFLKTVKRRELSKAIGQARQHGDIGENAEYDAAKEAQGLNEKRISELEEKLANAQIIDEQDIPKDQAFVGARLQLRDLESEEVLQYTLVSELEADYMSLKKTLSVEEAYALGFKSTEPVYIAQNNSAVAFNR